MWVQDPRSRVGELPPADACGQRPAPSARVSHTHRDTQRARGEGRNSPPPLPFTLAPRPAWSKSLLSTRAREPGPGTGQAVACNSDPESTFLWPDLRPPGAYLGFLLGLVGASARCTPTPG